MTAIQITNGEAGASVRAKLNALPALQGSQLPKWQVARAAVMAGVRNARILILGDSTAFGYGAAGATWGSNLKAGAWPTRLASLIPGASVQSFLGNGDAAAANRYPGADSRINPAASGTWGLGGGSKVGIGQYPYLATAAATFAFTPATAFDTVEVYYLTDPTNGVGNYSFTVNIDGGASIGTINGNQAEGFRKATFTKTLGTGTINCVWGSGNCYLAGIVAYNSAVKEVTIINAGSAGAKIADVVAPPSTARLYSPLNSLATLAPDVIAVGFTINDWNTPTDPTTYRARLDTLFAQARSIGADVLGVTGNPSNPATRASLAVQKQYVDAFKSACVATGAPVVDIWTQYGDFTAANAVGIMIDDVHSNATGYAVHAHAVSKALLAA